MDLTTKKPVLVKVTSQSQVLKLPPQVAQGIAARLKGAATETPAGGPPGGSSGAGAAGAPAESARQGGGGQRPGSIGASPQPGGAQANLQQMLSRMPPATLADFQKGDAVMIVSTEGTNTGAVTAITLVGGVEPILSASPNGGQEMTLSPWNLGTGGGDAAEAGP